MIAMSKTQERKPVDFRGYEKEPGKKRKNDPKGRAKPTLCKADSQQREYFVLKRLCRSFTGFHATVGRFCMSDYSGKSDGKQGNVRSRIEISGRRTIAHP